MRWNCIHPYYRSKGGHFGIVEDARGKFILEGGDYKGEFATLKEAKDFVKVNMERWKGVLKDECEL